MYSLWQVCDGVADCSDNSDECICSDVISGERSAGCTTHSDSIVAGEQHNVPSNDTFASCFTAFYTDLYRNRKSYGDPDVVRARCEARCKGFKVHCGKIDFTSFCAGSHVLRYKIVMVEISLISLSFCFFLLKIIN